MRLEKIHFEAYKSLLKETLELTDSCVGLVGTNESGKSNILSAVSSLSDTNPLAYTDSPKMGNKPNPYVIYKFKPNKDEQKNIRAVLTDWGKHLSVDIGSTLDKDFFIEYHVKYDKGSNLEYRYYSIENITIPSDHFVLRNRASTSEEYLFDINNEFVPLHKAVLVSKKQLELNKNINVESDQLSTLREEIEDLKKQISDAENTSSTETENIDNNENQTDSANQNGVIDSIDKFNITKKQQKLTELHAKEKSLLEKLVDFNICKITEDTQEEIREIISLVEELEPEIENAKAKVKELQDSQDKKELNTAKKTLSTLIARKNRLVSNKLMNERTLRALQEPISEKFCGDPKELSQHFGSILDNFLDSLLPKVVFWEHSDDYILQGEIEFEEILDAEELDDIPRPLLNLFRIGLKVNTLEDIQSKIKEIQKDPSERSRGGKRLNERVADYLMGVWPDYDQRIEISLEKERIRIQIYDPNCKGDASFYAMKERSDGAQTFLSFLLTIGAEAKHGVLKDTVLLLDEPELHLHPSGVRYMLEQLIQAAKKGNSVIYATHSVFMIDRNNYDRHVRLEKQLEQTKILASKRKRIGYFMLEEVLHLALDIDLSKDFDTTNIYNFVFEGDGDAQLFEHFYNEILTDEQRPFPSVKTSFYQGGKCNDILDHFKRRPIQLGSTWVFILDNDKPAGKLKKFLENFYKKYINDCIYIFQYNNYELKNGNVEFEDLLGSKFISSVVQKAMEKCIEGSTKNYGIESNQSFSTYIEKVIKNVDDKSIFKAKIKEILNLEILDITKNGNNLESFSQFIPNG